MAPLAFKIVKGLFVKLYCPGTQASQVGRAGTKDLAQVGLSSANLKTETLTF